MEILHSKKMSQEVSTSSTQKYLDVKEVKEDVIILKNGSMRFILAVSAINFDLKSSEEQEAIINNYKDFINSLDFPIQIIISSRKLNMQNYLDYLDSREKEQPNELLRFQIFEYKKFIDQLVKVSNIMEKNFYVVIPFSPIENKEGGFFSNLLSLKNPQKNILEKRENFKTYKNQLIQRVDLVKIGLSRIGVKLIPLKTKDLIELLFDSYNPEVYNTVELKDPNKLEFIK